MTVSTTRSVSAGTKRLQDLLTHIYVLVPVLDAEKHYWVGDRRSREASQERGRLACGVTPSVKQSLSRYLRYDRRLTRDALAAAGRDEDAPDPEAVEQVRTNGGAGNRSADAIVGSSESAR